MYFVCLTDDRLIATTVCYRVLTWSVRYAWTSFFFFFLMIRRPPRSTLDRSSAASDVYKRQDQDDGQMLAQQPRRLLGRQALDRFRQAVGFNQRPPAGAVHIEVPQPVSYTHLRAHETVLDLVCRLLLEKKKPSHMSQTVLLYTRTIYTAHHET